METCISYFAYCFHLNKVKVRGETSDSTLVLCGNEFGRSYIPGNGGTDPGLSGEQSESKAGLGFDCRSLRVEGRGGVGEAL